MGNIDRRSFMKHSAAAGLAATVPATPWLERAPLVHTPKAIRPLVISDFSGVHYRNGGPMNTLEMAFSRITQGHDVLDALIAGVNIPELDPTETGIGYGSLGNEDGVVQLDASVMHGPKKRAGAVAAIEGVRTPSLVAKAVMELHRSSSAGREGRAGFCALNGLHGRRRPEHARIATSVAGVEATHRPASTGSIRRSAAAPGSTRACRCCAMVSSPNTASGARSTAAASTRTATSAASPPPAASPGRSRAALVIRPFSAPDCTSTTTSAPPARPAAARPTCTTFRRT